MSGFWINFGIVIAGMVAGWLIFRGVRLLVKIADRVFPNLYIDDPGFVATVIIFLLALALGAAFVVTYGDQSIGGQR